MFSAAEIAAILKVTPSGYRAPQDDFFMQANNSLLSHHKKLGVISDADHAVTEDAEEPSSSPVAAAEIFCNAPGCHLRFAGASAYQTHFNSVHRFHCAECRRALPTAHLLDLHLSEQHDSYFEASVARGKTAMYACLLEECKELLWTPELRKAHCIQAHKFPANFRFDQLSASGSVGNKKDKSKKAVNGSTKVNATPPDMVAMETDAQNVVAEVGDSNREVRQIKAFSFGHQKGGKTFHTKYVGNKAGKTLDSMQTLKDALEDI